MEETAALRQYTADVFSIPPLPPTQLQRVRERTLNMHFNRLSIENVLQSSSDTMCAQVFFSDRPSLLAVNNYKSLDCSLSTSFLLSKSSLLFRKAIYAKTSTDTNKQLTYPLCKQIYITQRIWINDCLSYVLPVHTVSLWVFTYKDGGQ